MLQKVQISEIAKSLLTDAGYFTIQYAGIEYIQGLDFINTFVQRFFDWSFAYWNDDLTAVDAFKDAWITFLAVHENSIHKLIQSITTEYNVTDEYMRTITTAMKNTHTTSYGKSTTETPNNYSTTTQYGGSRSGAVTTFDNTSYRPDTNDSNSGSDTVTTNGSITTATEGADTVTDERLPAENIVTESGRNKAPTDAVRNEIELRLKYDLNNIICKMFSSEYCYLEV